MPHPTNYLDSAARWRRDLGLLPSEASPESTDHMAGLAAECVCKVLLAALGAPVVDGGMAEARHKVHLPYVLDELLCLVSGRNAPAVLAYLPHQNPFRNWVIDDRYIPNGIITERTRNDHKEGMDQLFSALQAAALDGELL